MIEDFKFLILLVFICSVTVLLTVNIQRISCLKSYEDLTPSYGVFEGCRVLVDGKLIPVEILRKIR